MSLFRKGDPNIKAMVEHILQETESHAVELSKGMFKTNPDEVRLLVATSLIVQELGKIRYELMFMNHQRRMEQNPMSMMNMDLGESDED